MKLLPNLPTLKAPVRKSAVGGLCVLALLASQSAQAANATWTGNVNSVWANSSNWTAAYPAWGNTATFSSAGNGNTTIDLTGFSGTVQNIAFGVTNTTAASGYTIGSGAVGSQTFSLNTGGTISIASGVGADQVVNANITLGDGTGNGSITLTNNSLAATLSIAGNLTPFGSSGSKTLNLNGAGNGVISGVVATGSGTASTALTKSGAGTWTLTGANTYAGATTVNGGTLKLDFSAAGAPANNIVSSSSALTLGSAAERPAVLLMQGAASGSNSQTFNGTSLGARSSSVVNVASGAGNIASLNLGALSRNGEATVNFVTSGSGTSTISTTYGAANGILVATSGATGAAFATFNGNDWAAKDASNANVVAFTGNVASGTGSLTTNGNIDMVTDTTLSANTAVNTLRFNDATARTLDIGSGNTLTLNQGGILVGSNAGAGTKISGGALTSGVTANGGVKELIIHQNNTSSIFEISSSITGAVGLVKTGAGTLLLSGNNTYGAGGSGSSVPNVIQQGVVKAGSSTALGNSASGNALSMSAGSTLDLNGNNITLRSGNTSLASLGGAGTIDNTSATDGRLTIEAAGSTVTLTSFVFQDSGAGKLALNLDATTGSITIGNASVSNTYSGTTTIVAGTVNVDGGGNTSALNPFGTGSVVNNGTLAIYAANIGNDISGTGALTAGKSGQGGLITLGGALSYTGATTISNNSSVLLLTGSAALGDVGYTAGGKLLTSAGGSLTVSGTSSGTGAGQFGTNGGSVILDYTTNNTSKITDTATLLLGGGSIQLKNGSHTEVVANTTVDAAGATSVTRSGGTSTLQLGALNRTTGGNVDFGAGSIATTNTSNTNGILGSYATVGGADWATSATTASNTPITAFSGYGAFAGSGSSTSNVLLTGGTSTASDYTVNSLKISGIDESLLIGSGKTLQMTSGGLLFVGQTSGLDNYTISGGTLKGSSSNNSDLVVHQYGAGSLTISSIIANGGNNTALTKTGSGLLILSGANTYSGATFINQGAVSISSNANLGSESTGAAVNLNGGTLRVTSTMGLYNGSAGTNNRNVGLGGAGGTFEVTSGNTFTVAGVVSNVNGYTMGGLTKSGAGTMVITNQGNTYTGRTLVNAGTLLVNGSVASSSQVVVTSGATLGGSGFVSAISANGAGGHVAPGNSAGILTALSTQGGTGLVYDFEFTALGGPTYSNPTASVNDVLRLTSDTPFTYGNLNGTNTVNVYLPNLRGTLRGGFFTDLMSPEALLAAVQGANFNYYVLGTGPGAVVYNGQSYVSLAADWSVTLSTYTEASADFQNGTVINGTVTQFTVVPEPAPIATFVSALAILFGINRLRRRTR